MTNEMPVNKVMRESLQSAQPSEKEYETTYNTGAAFNDEVSDDFKAGFRAGQLAQHKLETNFQLPEMTCGKPGHRWRSAKYDIAECPACAHEKKAISDALKMIDNEPDYWYCAIDPDEFGDNAHEAMFEHRPRLEPVELRTSYIGPKKWGVMSPALPDARDDSETAHTFDTEEEAQTFCNERILLIRKDDES